jgi:hypothetical protein
MREATSFPPLDRPNGAQHPCIQKEAIEKLNRDTADAWKLLKKLHDLTEANHILLRENSEMLDRQSVAIMNLDGKVGGVDPRDPMKMTGLLAAVHHVSNRQLEVEKDIRPRLDSLEEGEITKVQNREDLILRSKQAERMFEQAEQRAASAEKELRKVNSNMWSLFAKVIVGMITGGGIVGLVRMAWEMKK